jgi:SAM-dependent methyltransferase
MQAGEFLPAVRTAPRINAQCADCGSLERHRLAWLFLVRIEGIFFAGQPSYALHRPVPCLSARFRSLPRIAYAAADPRGGSGIERMDITKIRCAAMTFDLIFCSHVLEDVEDDRKAISELHRVLSAAGTAILMVPINERTTYEDQSIRDPNLRERHFGQWDHVRSYGPDFETRLREGGMQVTCFKPADFVSDAELGWMSMSRTELIFRCGK